MKLLRVFLWLVIVITFLFGLAYMFNGSLEMFPTAEQQEKVRFAAAIMMIVPLILGAGLCLTRKSKIDCIYE